MKYRLQHIFARGGQDASSQRSPGTGSSNEVLRQATSDQSSAHIAPSDHWETVRLLPVTSQDKLNPTFNDQNSYGIQVIAAGRDDILDVVFVHGLMGNAYTTWTHKDSGLFWPDILLHQDIPNARLMTFGYPADVFTFWKPTSRSKMTNHAESLVDELVSIRSNTDSEDRPLYFVAHSMGGLVVQHALHFSRTTAISHYNGLDRYTYGMALLGVPMHGSGAAYWASLGATFGRILAPNQALLKVLDPDSELLRQVCQHFHDLLRLRERQQEKLDIACFYEDLATKGVMVVPSLSAELLGYPCIRIGADHIGMTKFHGRKDPGYNSLLAQIRRCVKNIGIGRGPGPQAGSNQRLPPPPNSSGPSTPVPVHTPQAQTETLMWERKSNYEICPSNVPFVSLADDVHFLLRADGELLVYRYDIENILSRSHVAQYRRPDETCRLIFQSDGNLVIYYGEHPIWSSNTHTTGLKLVFRNRCPWLEVLNHNNVSIWNIAHTHEHYVRPSRPQ